MYKIVHYGDQLERTWALLNSYGSEFTQVLQGTLNSYLLLRTEMGLLQLIDSAYTSILAGS